MTHNDAHVSELLTDYVSGHLGKNEADRVTAHVRGCALCRSDLEALRILAKCVVEDRMITRDDHISDEELWQYYNSRDSLDDSARKNIEAHIDHCLECSSALGLLTGLEHDLVQTQPSKGVRVRKTAGFGEVLLQFLRKPALAYALLALAVYPTARWLTGNGEKNQVAHVTRMPESTFRLASQLRSASDAVSVIRRDREALLLLELPFYVMPEGKIYSVSVSGSGTNSGTRPAVESMVIPGPQGVVNVLLNTASFADGPYDLSLLEIDKNNVSDTSISHFAFKLITEP